MKRYRHWLWLLALLPLGLGLARLRFDAEVLNLLPDRSPVVRGLKLYQAHFANAQQLIVTLESADPVLTESAAKVLGEALRGRRDLIGAVVWQPPWMEAPEEAVELTAYLHYNQPPSVFSNLMHRLQGAAATNTLQEARLQLAQTFSPAALAQLSYDPLRLLDLADEMPAAPIGTGPELFASEDGTFRVMFVDSRHPLPHYKECAAWLAAVREVEGSLRAQGKMGDSVRVGYTGRPAFLAEIASGMERDMSLSVAGTFLIIAVLFYWMHRRWKPLGWLGLMLAILLVSTTALGGLIFGTLNVVSLGFAAILLGLSADYGLVLYQEACAEPEASLISIRRAVAPSILWSAATTAAAFGLLNISSLPGLSQLGTLVGAGLLLAALLMLGAYLPPLVRHRLIQRPPGKTSPGQISGHDCRAAGRGDGWAWGATIALVVLGTIQVWNRPPILDHTARALRPQHSPAYAAVETIQSRLERTQDPMWLLITGTEAEEVGRALGEARPVLEKAVASGWIDSYTIPGVLWPDPVHQAANRPLAAAAVRRGPALERIILSQGFNTNALAVPRAMLRAWDRAASSPHLFWPTNAGSRWVLAQMISHTDRGWIALGLVHPTEDPDRLAEVASKLQTALPGSRFLLSSWGLLGPALLAIVETEVTRVLVPMAGILALCLGLAYRSVRGLILSLATVLVSGCGLHLVMAWTGWSWNLMNLMALPLLLGAGVDYSIHIQLALGRHHGDLARVRRTIGRALLLCAATTATAFGSLGFSSNAGLASLGQVCAAGLVCCFFTAVYLLPVWWKAVHGGPSVGRGRRSDRRRGSIRQE